MGGRKTRVSTKQFQPQLTFKRKTFFMPASPGWPDYIGRCTAWRITKGDVCFNTANLLKDTWNYNNSNDEKETDPQSCLQGVWCIQAEYFWACASLHPPTWALWPLRSRQCGSPCRWGRWRRTPPWRTPRSGTSRGSSETGGCWICGTSDTRPEGSEGKTLVSKPRQPGNPFIPGAPGGGAD